MPFSKANFPVWTIKIKIWLSKAKFERIAIRKIFVNSLFAIATALMGILLSNYFELYQLKENVSAEAVNAVVIFVSFTFLFIMLSILLELNKNIEASRNYNVFLNRDYRVDETIKNFAFSYCASEVLKARKSIVVMGPHFERSVAIPELRVGTDSHDDYLNLSLGAAIKRHLVSIESDFRYVRVVQVDETVFQSIVDNKGVMQPFQFDNDSLAHHVEEMLNLERSPTVELSISVMPYLPSFPSILVIDDRFVFFSVPTGLTGRNEILKYGSVRTNFDVVFGIEDVSGEIPILFRQIIMQLKRSAKKVVKVDNNSVDS